MFKWFRNLYRKGFWENSSMPHNTISIINRVVFGLHHFAGKPSSILPPVMFAPTSTNFSPTSKSPIGPNAFSLYLFMLFGALDEGYIIITINYIIIIIN
ncbi:hypothetical protein CsatB_000128 [Cannabis sativa]